MHPILFKFKLFGTSYLISSYGIFILTGAAFAVLLTLYLAKQNKTGSHNCLFIKLMLLFASGFLFAIAVSFLLFLPSIIKTGSLVKSNFGIVSWGGIMGGCICMFMMAKYWNVDFAGFADLILPGFVLSHAFGRLGCHFAGCCYGRITDGSFGFIYSDKMSPAYLLSCGKNLLIPTQLISACFLFALCAILTILFFYKAGKGIILVLYLISYSGFRFIVELYRSDPRVFIWGYSDGQAVSVIMFFAGIVFLYFRFIKKNPAPQM
jgi:phosphatidylglycerol:prolipoprotein diacylglycerol transferase